MRDGTGYRATPKYESKTVLVVGGLFIVGMILLRLIVDHAFPLSKTSRLNLAIALGISLASALGWKRKTPRETEPSMWFSIASSTAAQIGFVVVSLFILLV